MKKYTFKEQLTGFPWAQLLILAAIRFAEPIAFTSLFPYIYFMVRSFHEGKDEHLVARYAGYISGAFAFAQVLTGILWGRFSDRHGRKPVVLIGMIGSIISLLMFGLSRNFYMAISARIIAGLLNGNVGVIRTIIGEIATKRRHQPIAFTIMPLLWQIGCVIGPVVGGYLADPLTSHPEWFVDGGPLHETVFERLFSRYRFLLPNLVVASILSCGLLFAFLFLDETLEDKKDSFDLGRYIGSKLIFWKKPSLQQYNLVDNAKESVGDEHTALLSSSRCSSSDDFAEVPHEVVDESWNAILVPRVNNLLVASFFLALHTMVFEELLPIYFCSKIINDPRLPFAGGMGLDSSQMGNILSTTGFTGIFMMLVVYPWIDKEFGTLKAFRWLLRGHPIMCFLTPFLLFLKKLENPRLIFLLLVIFVSIRTIFSSLSFPGLFLLVNRAAAHKRHLGTVNGTQQVVSSLARAIGPIIWGYLMADGMGSGHVELPWWSLSAFSFLGALHARLYVDDVIDEGDEDDEEDEGDYMHAIEEAAEEEM